MKTTETILFDLDGTLTNPEAGIVASLRHALLTLSIPSPSTDELRGCIGPPLRETFGALLGSYDPPYVERAVELYRDRYATVGLFENILYPGMEELLSTLQGAGYRLMVATSKPTVFARPIAEHFTIDRYFSAIYGSDLGGVLDNKVELLGHILTEESLDPARTVMVGDRKHDIIAARENGMRSIGVTYGFGSVDELQMAGADWIVGSPEEIGGMFLG